MQWNLIHERGGPEWNAFLEEMLSLDVTLDPTMTPTRRAGTWTTRCTRRGTRLHAADAVGVYEANREDHGSYYFDWTTWEEVAWRDFLEVWHDLLNDYKNMGGRVTASSDAGYIYNLMGFSTIQKWNFCSTPGSIRWR